MYELFELARLLSVISRDTTTNTSSTLDDFNKVANDDTNVETKSAKSSPSIECYAFTGPCKRQLVALALTNYNIVFYAFTTPSCELPSVRQLPWFTQLSMGIVALCFDPSGCWLLISTRDATLFIFPTAAFFSGPVSSDNPWSIEDLTEIKLSGRRAIPTAILWWKTSRAQSIAIIGNELGEISFVDLELRKEVGGTYITVSITHLELITDDASGRVYLLITGSNDIQWQLILEQDKRSYQFPLDGINVERSKPTSGPTPSRSFLSCLSTLESDLRLSPSKDGVNGHDGNVLHPRRLARHGGNIRLRFAERFRGRKYISGYSVVKDVFTLHLADLNIVPSYAFKLPPCVTRHVVLGENLMFVVTDDDAGPTLRVLAVNGLTMSSMDALHNYDINCELQLFRLTFLSNDILDMVRCRLHSTVGSRTGRFGCLIITKTGLYCLRQTCFIEDEFLRLVLEEGSFTKADRLAKILSLDVGMLYEKAAEAKLLGGHVGSAVQLYQMAKCPHIRSVANFAAYGYLTEVLSYIRALFSKPTFDFSLTDLKHFSNLALYCYVQQCLRHDDDGVIRQHFRNFLIENRYYDEVVAVHLLATYGFFKLLTELSESRGLFPQTMDELLPPFSKCSEEPFSNESKVDLDFDVYDHEHLKPAWINKKMTECLSEQGFGHLLFLDNDVSFVECLLRPSLSSFFGLNFDIAWRHLMLVKRLSGAWMDNVDRLKSLIKIYDPSNPVFEPAFRQSNSIKKNANINFLQTEIGDDIQIAAFTQEMTDFFLKLLLLLNKTSRKDAPFFNLDLVAPKFTSENRELTKYLETSEEEQLKIECHPSSLAAGFAHAGFIVDHKLFTWGRNINGCLGRGPARRDWLVAECVSSLRPPLLKVRSVACGAAHTLVLTEYNAIYAFGSNRYGQLGVSDADANFMCDQTCHPLLIKSLPADCIIASIACGQYHSLALTTKGIVYSWGWGIHGQLGHGNSTNVLTPQVMNAFTMESINIINLSAGYAHSVFLTAEGSVFICGCGQFGQLGTGQTSKSSVPIQVQLPEVIRLVAAGYVHNIAITNSGRIFTWGCNPRTLRLRAQAARRNRSSSTRLGSGKLSDIPNSDLLTAFDPRSSLGIFFPTQVDSNEIASKVMQVSCGANHTVLVTNQGEAYSWGRNLDGQLGHEGRKERMMPVQILKLSNRKVLSAACGGDVTLVLDDSGNVWGFGVDEFGQIGGAATFNSGLQEAVPAPSLGKMHTLRTSKRVIVLKPSMRCSVFQPTMLSRLPTAKLSSDEVFSIEPPTFPCRKLWNTTNVMDYNNYIVHLALEQLRGFYNADVVEELCLSVGNFQAAAKVALLKGIPSKSFCYNLRAISADDTHIADGKQCNLCLTVLEIYFTKLCINDADILKPILEVAITFWIDNGGSTPTLEDYFTIHLSQILFAISSIILSYFEPSEGANEKLKKFVGQLSSQFCLEVVSKIMETIKTGTIHPQLTILLSDSVNKTLLKKLRQEAGKETSSGCLGDNSTSSIDHLWDDLIQNLWKDAPLGVTSTIDLSSVEVMNLLCDSGSGSAEIILFTCGHHYPKEEFMTNVLPSFEVDLQTNTTVMNFRSITAGYETMGFQSTACPKCLLDGLQQEAT